MIAQVLCCVFALFFLITTAQAKPRHEKPDETLLFKKSEQGDLSLLMFYPPNYKKSNQVPANMKVDTNYTDTSKCANQGYIAGADLEHYTSQSYPEVRNGTTNVTTDGSKPTTTISNTTLVTGNNWPEAARRIAMQAGLQPVYESLAKPAESKDGDMDRTNALDALLGEVQ